MIKLFRKFVYGDNGEDDFLCAGGAEIFVGGVHRGAGRPDIVEKKVSRFGVNFSVRGQFIGGGGLGETGRGIGADLDGVFRAGEEFLDFDVGLWVSVAESGKVFRDKVSMVEAAFADMFLDSGEGNDDEGRIGVVGKTFGKNCV